jgi:tripartite-type tricarboxylate transporter receptor subunit TctC
MTRSQRRAEGLLRRASCALLCAFAGAPAAGAGEGVGGYPANPIRLVVPYTPGGIVDIVARITANALASQLGRSVVVDNRAGAGGTIAMKAVVAVAPDGYTLGIATTGPMAIAPVLLGSAGTAMTSPSPSPRPTTPAARWSTRSTTR